MRLITELNIQVNWNILLKLYKYDFAYLLEVWCIRSGWGNFLGNLESKIPRGPVFPLKIPCTFPTCPRLPLPDVSQNAHGKIIVFLRNWRGTRSWLRHNDSLPSGVVVVARNKADVSGGSSGRCSLYLETITINKSYQDASILFTANTMSYTCGYTALLTLGAVTCFVKYRSSAPSGT